MLYALNLTPTDRWSSGNGLFKGTRGGARRQALPQKTFRATPCGRPMEV